VLELDHVAFGVADAEVIRAELERLGFTPTAAGVCRWSERGRPHESRATSVVFPRAYLDLIEIRDPAWEEALLSSPLHRRGIAPSGVVVSSAAALADARATFAARGVAVGRPYAIERALPGAVPPTIPYEIFPLREPGFPFSVIADGAPGAMRAAAWLSHPNTATGLKSVHLRVPSAERWLARAELVFGSSAPELDLGSATLAVHREPRDPYLAAVAELLPRDDRTRLLAVEVSVLDASPVRTILARSRIPAVELEGGIGVEPSAGFGCGIVFVEAGRSAIARP
jgi:hypothetical protein